MNRWLAILLVVLSALAAAQPYNPPQTVRSVENLAELVALRPEAALSFGRGIVMVRGRVTAGDWGDPRPGLYATNQVLATNADWVFNGAHGGQWILPDRSNALFIAYTANAITSRWIHTFALGAIVPVGQTMSLGGVSRSTWPTDADTLDGFDGAFYLARANHTGTQPWSTLTGTPTTLAGYGITDPVWTAVNDGSGSGLDADLLDGQSEGYFRNRTNHTGTQAVATIIGLQGYLDSKAATNHTHTAADVTSGEFETARLGTGTSDTDTVLFGNAGGPASWRQLGTNDVAGLSDWFSLKADVYHTHHASNITAGVFSASRLGTGSSTVGFTLYANGSADPYWGSPPSGSAGTNGIPDADSDGIFYGRRNGSWVAPDIADVFGMTLFGSNFVKQASTAYDAREKLELVGVSIATIDSPAKHNVRANSSGVGTPRHRLNLIGGTGVSVSLSDDGANDETDVTVRLSDRDWGDITSGSSGTTLELDADSVGSAEIAANAVGNSELADDAVGSAEIAAGAVGSSELADGGVATADIGDAQVSLAKLANMNQGRLLGRANTGGSGAPQEVTLGSGLSMSTGGVLSATAPAGALAGWARFTTIGPSPYGITSATYDGTLVNGVTFNRGDGDEPMDVTISFASSLSNYFVQVEIEASGYGGEPSTDAAWLHPQWWLQGGHKTSTGFDLQSTGTSPPAMGYGHTWTVWIFSR